MKDTKRNLCDTCVHLLPECLSTSDDIEWGDGPGSDNIIGCPHYISKEVKAAVEKVDNLDTGSSGTYYGIFSALGFGGVLDDFVERLSLQIINDTPCDVEYVDCTPLLEEAKL
jgi:hypothetical protein